MGVRLCGYCGGPISVCRAVHTETELIELDAWVSIELEQEGDE